MPRPDGEDWLEGRPLHDDTHETGKEARAHLRNPRWWLVVLVAASLVGVGWEAVAAALGDGEFTIRTGIQDAIVVFCSLVVATLVFAVRRT